MMLSTQLANACAQEMERNDPYSKRLGLKLIDADEGLAIVNLTVNEDMLNGHGTCHGGVIFSLADTAFAYACNSQNQLAVAASCTIDFVRPSRLNDVLTATAKLQYQGKRTGVYQTMIVNQDNKLIAIFKGNAARLGQTVINTEPEDSI